VAAADWGGRAGQRPGRRTVRPTTAKTMVRACYETSSWTCNSHYAGRCRGWCWTNTARRRLLPRPLPRMRGERKEAGWRTRWRQLMRRPSLSCEGIDGQMSRVWRAGPRHDPFNSVWASSTQASCRAWAVASAHSAGSARHDYFFILEKNCIYICTLYIQYLKHISMKFYWLAVVSPALLPLWHRFKPHLLQRFLTFYADLTK
jgi:hypothetical protein